MNEHATRLRMNVSRARGKGDHVWAAQLEAEYQQMLRAIVAEMG